MTLTLEEKQSKIQKLRGQISECKRCSLCKTRTNVVPGEGDVDADIMFIGEAPGKNEDLKGEPFVGRAGNIFDVLLESVDMTREQIYLCNILKCRPPGNRNPMSEEIKSCVGSLDIQIKTIDPKIIATLGSFATTYIFNKFSIKPATISSVAGKVINIQTPFGDKIIVPLFHPAVATYNASKTDDLISDFQVFRRLVDEQKEEKSEPEYSLDQIIDKKELENRFVEQMEMWPQ